MGTISRFARQLSIHSVNRAKVPDLSDLAFKFGINGAGALLALPPVLTTFFWCPTNWDALHLLHVLLWWLIVGVLPVCACLSVAMRVCPPAAMTAETDTALHRTGYMMFGRYVLALTIPYGSVLLSQMHRAGAAGRALLSGGFNLEFGEMLVVGVLAVAVGCWVGESLGVLARRDQFSRLARLLGWCWRVCLPKSSHWH